MLLKNLIKLPEKKEIVRNSFDNSVKNGCDTGYNQAIEKIGNLEIELDAEKIAEILNRDLIYLENSEDKIDRVRADVMRHNNKTYAKIIAVNFKEIIK